MEIQDYIKQINEQYRTGNAREHSYRPMLQQLLGDMLPKFTVTNEPARVECGAPDYIITTQKTNMPVFFIEAKDINDSDLDGHNQHKEQFNRYKESLDHIIFTDYLDFHLYENGQWIKNVRLAEIQGNNIRLIKDSVPQFEELVAHIASTHPTPITSPTRLAQQMAAKARILARTINEAFRLAQEDDEAAQLNQQLQQQLDAFRRVLIHDLTPEGFADIYAQTLAYGMFAARLHDDTPEDFSRHEAAELIPKSNPFLRQIFQSIAGYDLDVRIAWVVDDLVSIFLATDIRKVMDTYAKNDLHHDPMIHFYEDFLTAYNPTLRKSKGVWYTPQPVVQFIVRAVDEILQRDFNLADGLADHSMIEREVMNEAYYPGAKDLKGKPLTPTIRKQFHRVQILDPATGTGTFLAETVNQIYDKFRGMQGMWQGYVTDHLLPRLHGFELLMASYAVAHLKLDMLLTETGFKQPQNQKRLKIYLTNSLEECHPDTGTLWSSWLSNEANEANHIKRDCPVMVMMGNPPYNAKSQNNGEWITKKIEDYKYTNGEYFNERKHWLNDDYVKFIRLAQDYIDRNEEGLIAFINNHSFIDNVTFRSMRWNLLRSFDDIYIINLNGNGKRPIIMHDGSKDENVFDIMQGVSINIFVKTGKKNKEDLGNVHYFDLVGKREEKYQFLNATEFSKIPFIKVEYSDPYYFFMPRNEQGIEKYNQGIKLDDLFSISSTGVLTSGDAFVVAGSKNELQRKINDFINPDLSAVAFQNNYGLGKNYVEMAFSNKPKISVFDDKFQEYDYRLFDTQWIYYDPNLLWRSRDKVMCNVLNHYNVVLSVCRQSIDSWRNVFISNKIIDDSFISNKTKERGYAFPLYLYMDNMGTEEKVPNLNPAEWKKFNDAVGREVAPEELLAYIYAVLHSPTYRERYKEFLKVDFPRIPLPTSAEEFDRLVSLGQQLIDIHLMKNNQSWKTSITFPEPGTQVVEQFRWDDGKVWINKTQYFGNVPEVAWSFFIGGYQPAQKWLKDRKGRTLSFDDIKHYMHIIYALSETDRLMKEIG